MCVTHMLFTDRIVVAKLYFQPTYCPKTNVQIWIFVSRGTTLCNLERSLRSTEQVNFQV